MTPTDGTLDFQVGKKMVGQKNNRRSIRKSPFFAPSFFCPKSQFQSVLIFVTNSAWHRPMHDTDRWDPRFPGGQKNGWAKKQQEIDSQISIFCPFIFLPEIAIPIGSNLCDKQCMAPTDGALGKASTTAERLRYRPKFGQRIQIQIATTHPNKCCVSLRFHQRTDLEPRNTLNTRN
jgi:hypothetical protein